MAALTVGQLRTILDEFYKGKDENSDAPVYFSSDWGERKEITDAMRIEELGELAEVPYLLLIQG